MSEFPDNLQSCITDLYSLRTNQDIRINTGISAGFVLLFTYNTRMPVNPFKCARPVSYKRIVQKHFAHGCNWLIDRRSSSVASVSLSTTSIRLAHHRPDGNTIRVPPFSEMLDRFCESRVLAGPTSPATPSAGLQATTTSRLPRPKWILAPRRRAGRALVIEGEEFRMAPSERKCRRWILCCSRQGNSAGSHDRGQRAVIILKERSQVHVIRQGIACSNSSFPCRSHGCQLN